jgi:hypothetical protein
VARTGLTTTQKGLGYPHQKARVAALKALRDGDPCARCEFRGRYHPMYRAWAKDLELDDFPPRVIARALGIEPVKRLSWKFCNRSAGGRLGNKIKAARRGTPPKPSQYTRW